MKPSRNSILRVSRYLLKYKGLFSLTLFLAVCSTFFVIMIPRVVRWCWNEYISTPQTIDLVIGVSLIALCYFGREAFNSLRIRVNNTLEQKVLVDLRGALHSKLLVLPVGFFDRRKSGELASRVVEDVDAVERALLDGTEQGTVALLSIIGVAFMLFLESPFLAAFICLPLPILLLLWVSHSRATRKNWKEVRIAAGELNAQLVEDIQGNRLIHSFALRRREEERFMANAGELRQRSLKAMFRWSLYGPGTSFISSLGLVAVVGLGGYMSRTDPSFDTGDLLMFFMYGTLLYEPLGRLHQLNHMISAGRSAGDRVFEILDEPLDVESPFNPKPLPSGAPEIVYDNISFHYNERATVLTDFKLTLEAGKVTALVGHTGAGKSTIANLLMRYYDVEKGAVLYGGADVREYDLEELRSSMGYVAQEPFLFEGTVRENMHLARPTADEASIVKALKGASAWEFVERLPDGLDTNIGEKGIRLSQGERQRLTIARVLLKNPRMIILDEATASVDTVTESLIQEALATLMSDRTVLVIAHRLSTVKDADNIVVLDKGSIAEQGSHAELLERNGVYAELWRRQADMIPESSR